MIHTVKKKVYRLKSIIFENSLFLNTLENHQYLPLKEVDLQLFEKRHQIKLPDAYRNFLKYISNGGFGPNHGVIPLKMNKTYDNLHLPWTDPKVYNHLFKHDCKKENDDAYTNRVDDLLDDNESSGAMLYNSSDHGVLCIKDSGCGSYTILVLDGEHKGEVWVNLTVNDDGFRFEATNFLIWYQNWLDGKIAQVKVKNESIKNRIFNTIPLTSLSNDTRALHEYIGVFKDVKDKTSVTQLFEQLLQIESLSHGIVDVIIDYCVHREQFINYSLALQYIDRALTEKKDQNLIFIKEKLCQKGKALVGLGQFKQAISYFEEAMTLSGDNYPKGTLKDEYLRLGGYAYLLENQIGKTKAVIAPRNETYTVGNAVELLGELFEKYNNYKMAIRWGETLLSWELFFKDPHYTCYLKMVYLNLIFSYARIANKTQVDLYTHKLNELAKEKGSFPFQKIALELYNAKYYEKSLDVLIQYESDAIGKDDIQWIYNLKGCCYTEMKNHTEAIRYFQKSFAISHLLVPYSNLIRNYIHLKEFEKAQEVFDEIVGFDPYYSWSYYQFSLLHLKANKHHKAIDSLKKAISLGFDKKVILDDIELSSIHTYFKD